MKAKKKGCATKKGTAKKKCAPKKAAAKKKTVAAKKTVAKKKTIAKKKVVAKKKTSAITDTDQVLNIVKRYKKGVNVATLMERTGFEDKKVRNILYRATKRKKVKRVGTGLYAGA